MIYTIIHNRKNFVSPNQIYKYSFNKVKFGKNFSANVLRKCHRSDPNLNDCIKDAIEDLRPYLARGKSLVL